MQCEPALLRAWQYLGVLHHWLHKDWIAAYGDGEFGAWHSGWVGVTLRNKSWRCSHHSLSTLPVLEGWGRVVIWGNRQDINKYSWSDLPVHLWNPRRAPSCNLRHSITADTPGWFCENQVKIYFPFLRGPEMKQMLHQLNQERTIPWNIFQFKTPYIFQ